MKKLLSKGKIIVSIVSVFAILAVSLLSMFSGVTFFASADDETTEGDVVYPLNRKYDADVIIQEGGISYTDVDYNVKKDVSDFSGFDKYFCVDPETEGNGTAQNPFIIKTANQFAAVVTGNLLNAEDKQYPTDGVCFKIADNIKAFNLSNTDATGVDFSKDMTSAKVKAALENANITSNGVKWRKVAPFNGKMDGNGAVVYGLKVVEDMASIFPENKSNSSVRNLTVKNCYFEGDGAAVFFARNTSGTNEKYVFDNCAAYGNVVVVNRLNEALTFGGILIGDTQGDDTMEVNNCLFYDNSVKHSVYDITYGLVGRLHGSKSATISNSIVLDSVPHTQYYGSNAFHKSEYTNVYTNAIDIEYKNVDYVGNQNGAYKTGTKREYTYNYQYSATGVSATFTYRSYTNSGEEITASGNSADYSRTLASGTMIKKSADELKKATEINGLSADVWTYHEGALPTPKIYSVREYSAGEAWSGEVAVMYSAGDGTAKSPFEISTAEELALMLLTAEDGQCFKLVKDIVINDTSAENWTANAKQWFTSNDVPAFKGTFDGNDCTVKGIYFSGNQAGTYAGLLPVVGNSSTVKKLTVTDSSITGNSGVVGAVAGKVDDRCSKVIKFETIAIEDTVKLEGATKGGIIGEIGYSVVNFSDCISKSNGLFGSVAGGVPNVKRSISVNAYPFGDTENVKAVGVYTDTAGDTVEGLAFLNVEDMKGVNAEANMPGLNIPESWRVVVDDFPKATGVVLSSNGVKGEVWTGAIATDFAGGDGSEENPYLIETAEQLAHCVYDNKKTDSFFYKLTADIYLNDVESPLWAEKIGCNEWFNQRTTKDYENFKNTTFDGDGYVVYGLYIDHSDVNNEYIRAGLFPQVTEGMVVKNLGLSQAYLAGSLENKEEAIGGIFGVIGNWNNGTEFAMQTHDAITNEIVKDNPEFRAKQPKIMNCFIDHTCYFSGYTVGGFVSSISSPIWIENCIFTGTIDNAYRSATLVGDDISYGSDIFNCVSLPLCCTVPMNGVSVSEWRTGDLYTVTIAKNVYYFARKKQTSGSNFTRIANPEQRLGEKAKEAMTGLDWEKEIGDGGTWRVIDGGTPVLAVFGKHRSEEELEKFSSSTFTPPEVTIGFITNTDEVTVKDMTGPMYTKLTLPIIERAGYEFTGWYVFDDFSIEYPCDYYPPRDLTLYAGWKKTGVVQNFEDYPDTYWDYDDTQWILNKPGAKGGYKSKYVRNGAKSLHLFKTNTKPVDALLNYEDMLEPGKSYTITFWVTTDEANNPATLLSLVHNSKPVYIDTAVGIENMAVVTGLKVGEWVKYTYSFTAHTKWVSIRATAGSSLYFDDIVIAALDDNLTNSNFIPVNSSNSNVVKTSNMVTGSGAVAASESVEGTFSPTTRDVVSVAVLISAIMACAIVAVVSRKNLVEVID